MRRWDIFCRVVDNYGDAAVCWRLARQLSTEHGAAVRLWIDQPDTLAKLQPEQAGVEILRWDGQTAFADAADIAIDAFDSGLPDAYAARMTARSLWIKLEYLSAEPWVEAHHGLPSPHPTLPARRYFYFPGFTDRTGGLLREHDLFARRDAFDAAQFWRALGCAPPEPGTRVISLFGYENPALRALLQAWAQDPRDTLLATTDCPLAPDVHAFFGKHTRRGSLQVRYLPFLPQSRYDELLWACDWNFVRGEDSFVRAQWAARAFVWHIYPQPEDAHRAKLEAFLARYGGGAQSLWRAWNGWDTDIGSAWSAAQADEDRLRAQASAWADRLGAQQDLTSKLAAFCENLLK
ncbi:MAG: elongation factor P maturation arginine rhamnosyltransferase EarP [Burkholderiales bacterium]